MIISLKRHQKLLVLRDIELPFNTFFVRLRFQIGFKVLESWCKFMTSKDAFDFTILDKLKMRVRLNEFL